MSQVLLDFGGSGKVKSQGFDLCCQAGAGGMSPCLQRAPWLAFSGFTPGHLDSAPWLIKLNKKENSVSQSHSLHFKCSTATCACGCPTEKGKSNTFPPSLKVPSVLLDLGFHPCPTPTPSWQAAGAGFLWHAAPVHQK